MNPKMIYTLSSDDEHDGNDREGGFGADYRYDVGGEKHSFRSLMWDVETVDAYAVLNILDLKVGEGVIVEKLGLFEKNVLVVRLPDRQR